LSSNTSALHCYPVVQLLQLTVILDFYKSLSFDFDFDLSKRTKTSDIYKYAYLF